MAATGIHQGVISCERRRNQMTAVGIQPGAMGNEAIYNLAGFLVFTVAFLLLEKVVKTASLEAMVWPHKCLADTILAI